jgi:hypothetical protein
MANGIRFALAILIVSMLTLREAGAELVAIDGGLAVYDTALNISWLANANLATTKTFGITGINPDGSMSYTTAQSWVAAMKAANYLGSNQWSLPTTGAPDSSCSQGTAAQAFGYNCTGSMMGHLFNQQLGGVPGSTIQLAHNASYSLFYNFQPYLYWSDTKYPPAMNAAWSFSFGNGFQGTDVYANDLYAMVFTPGELFGGVIPLSMLLPPGAPTNAANVAGGIDNYINSGGLLTPNFLALLFGQPPSVSTLEQLSGEAATGAEHAAFQLMNEFLTVMLDPFVVGRGGGGVAIGFSPDQRANLPDDVALAYASILKAPAAFAQRWTAWGASYGGSNTAAGNPTVGSNDVSARAFGLAAGMDYHLSPDTVVGFSLAGGGTNWSLANGLGGGSGDAAQAGVYGVTHAGPAYLAAALAFANHWMTTDRFAAGDQLRANFDAQSYGGRAEAGYRFAVFPTLGVTPYLAAQVQDFHTPNYSETDLTGGGFGLAYGAMNATDARSEIGARLDDPTLLGGMPLILRSRVAWAHNWVSNPALSAAFSELPGASFVVNGAPVPQNSALVSAGAELFLNASLSINAKFDGEFANGSRTYAASGRLRYSW